jgi:hypothetical protein
MWGDREQMRAFFRETWRKAQAGETLQPMERIVAGVIEEHPEYHGLITGEDALHRDWTPEQGETNPFLHMGMHIALREQAGADRPAGIHALIEQLALHIGDLHEAEHRLMEPLGEAMWNAQRAGGNAPDERAYLEAVGRLVRDTTGRKPDA